MLIAHVAHLSYCELYGYMVFLITSIEPVLVDIPLLDNILLYAGLILDFIHFGT